MGPQDSHPATPVAFGTPAGTRGNDRLGPWLDRLIFFTPVVLVRIPHADVLKLQRVKADRCRIQPGRFNFSRDISIPGIGPVFAGPNHDDLAWEYYANVWVNAGEVRSLAEIALRARQRQIPNLI